MAQTNPAMRGSFRVAHVLGVDVFVHWSWALVGVVEMSVRATDFSGPFWNVLEYLSLFAIVLMHEFGHALACRSVGGRANQIVLWPLGGVAYVEPPQRPGAVLWSIAAGPLVNVVLVPITLVAYFVTKETASPDVVHYFQRLAILNGVLLAYNLLPFYPLDGGQILRSILWFFVGRARSLMAATAVGLVGAVLLGVVALSTRSVWLAVLGAFNAFRSWSSFKNARAMRQVELAPRRPGVRCPSCTAAPPMGAFWACPCGTRFDTFAENARCPACRRTYAETSCPECHVRSPWPLWMQEP